MNGSRPTAKEAIECAACHKLITIGEKLVNHHISYFPEKIVQVHISCHGLIHKSKTLYKELRPNPAQVRRWYKTRGESWDPDWFIDIKFDWFWDCVENGFLDDERKERELLKGIKKYWENVQKSLELDKRFAVKETWNNA